MIFSLSMKFLVTFEIYSTPNYKNISYCFHSHTKSFDDDLLISIDQDLLQTHAPSFILGKLFFELTP